MRSLFFFIPFTVGILGSVASEAAPYQLQTEIAVGGEGGWDYLSVDPASHRLYLSHGNSMVVIDINKNIVVGEIADTPGVHGIAIAADLAKGFTTNGRENKVSVVDLMTLKTLA